MNKLWLYIDAIITFPALFIGFVVESYVQTYRLGRQYYIETLRNAHKK